MKAERLGILSALLASVCCVTPLILVLLGLGSLGDRGGAGTVPLVVSAGRHRTADVWVAGACSGATALPHRPVRDAT